MPLDDSYLFEADNDKAQIKRSDKAQIKRNDKAQIKRNDKAQIKRNNYALFEKSILEYLGEHSQTTQVELAKATGKSRRSIQDAISLLKGKGLLTHEGARKNGRWVVR